jgi:hypothetical protein
MKQISTKSDLQYCYPIHQEEQEFLKELCRDNGEEWLSLPPEMELEEITGCTYYMVESVEDLIQIGTLVNQWKELVYRNITQQALEFDDVRWSKSTDHLIIFSGENNGGGPVWYIPRKIVAEVPTVFASLEATQTYWSSL